jgi:hypothetical protein
MVKEVEILVWNASEWQTLKLWKRPGTWWGFPSTYANLAACMNYYGDGGDNAASATRTQRPMSLSNAPSCRYSPESCLDEPPPITYEMENKTVGGALAVLNASSFSIEFRAPSNKDGFHWSTRTGIDIYLVDNAKFARTKAYEARMIYGSVFYDIQSRIWRAPGSITCNSPTGELFNYSIVICPFGMDQLRIDEIFMLKLNGTDSWEPHLSWKAKTYFGLPPTTCCLECLHLGNDGLYHRGQRPMRHSNTSFCEGGDERNDDDSGDIGEAPGLYGAQAADDLVEKFRVKFHGGYDAHNASTHTGIEILLVVDKYFDNAWSYEARMVYDTIIYDDSGNWTSPGLFSCRFPADESFSLFVCSMGMDVFEITEAEVFGWKGQWEPLQSWLNLSPNDDYWGGSMHLPSRSSSESACVRFKANGGYSRFQRPMRRSNPPRCTVAPEPSTLHSGPCIGEPPLKSTEW